ncbi:vasopressin V1a receptor-like [Penaeus chinensis]|uniref:vasopressin V1a receptor-like n=1 Tax=Penaeus chinensis TaxID=139456 RepID=UPI001FB7E296|nr:vasopressin V1a receptor-like [Penaeus chinensis]
MPSSRNLSATPTPFLNLQKTLQDVPRDLHNTRAVLEGWADLTVAWAEEERNFTDGGGESETARARAAAEGARAEAPGMVQPFFNVVNETFVENSEEPYPDVLGPNYHRHIRMGILTVMFALALVGNSRVMWVLRQKWSSRGRMTVMSFNVTLADTLVALITILGQLMWEILEKHWYLGNGACKIYKVASTFAITSSNYMLVAMAIDRHEAVVRPLNPFISAKNLALAAWAVSLLPSLPNLFIFAKAETPSGDFCVSKFYTDDLDKHFRQVLV